MMTLARYLIRFDDLCPTMNWDMWARIENALIEHKATPLLAVIPDNCDPTLMLSPPSPDFWSAVRNWQARGWTIGLHGYQHRYLTESAGIVGIQPRSEFAGLPLGEQREKLSQAVEILRRERVHAEAWVAPAHSFDWNTVRVLRDLDITLINDGFAIAPFTDARGCAWIPQQLWQFRWRPCGIWTVCYHHNHWDEQQLSRFLRALDKYHSRITNIQTVMEIYSGRQHQIVDSIYRVAHSVARQWRNSTAATS